MSFNLGDSFKKFTQSVKEKTGLAEPTKDPQEVLEAISSIKLIAREANDVQAAAKRWHTRELDAIEGLKVFASASSSCNESSSNLRDSLPSTLIATANARSEMLSVFKIEFLDVIGRFIDNELRLAEKAQKKNADARLDFDAKTADYLRLTDSRSARAMEIDIAKRKMDEAEQAYSQARRDFLSAAEICQEKKATLYKTNIATFASAMGKAYSDCSEASQKLARDCY